MLQNVETDASIVVDVRVKHLRKELDFRRFVGVVLGKLENQLEDASLPDRVFRPEDEGFPLEERVVNRGGLQCVLCVVFLHLLQILEKTTLGIRLHF